MNHCWPGPVTGRNRSAYLNSICWFFEGPAMRWPRMATSCWPVVNPAYSRRPVALIGLVADHRGNPGLILDGFQRQVNQLGCKGPHSADVEKLVAQPHGEADRMADTQRRLRIAIIAPVSASQFNGLSVGSGFSRSCHLMAGC